MTTLSGHLDADTFLHEFLLPARPVLVRGALADWPWKPPWDLGTLTERFGDLRAPLYDTLFTLRGLSTFGDYVRHHTGPAADGVPPYLRWFARQSEDPLPWADPVFAALAGCWKMPDWLPSSGYVFPYLPGTADPVRDAFPAKGLFVCGRGGRTRLHVDPWLSDACLCQATGEKHVVMSPPGPDDEPRFQAVLRPGDAVFIPAGWRHTVTALSDSVSITWNFVHQVHRDRFELYLDSGGVHDPAVSYFGVHPEIAAVPG